jgi:nicotinamide-nucleotide amidase
MIEIITIGDEILIGQIVDTNSAWLGVELNKEGFAISQITSVHDDKQHIINALKDSLQRADIVLLTGGLGPTKDDITKQTLCEYFDTKLIFDNSVYQNIMEMYKNRPYVMNELTKTQAYVPENCTVIQNTMGTAAIMWFETKDGKVVVSLPGVPYEMINAMTTEIIPRLKKRFQPAEIQHTTLLVAGIPESQLAIKLTDWENALPENLHLAYLPHYGMVKLRIDGFAENKDDGLSLQFSINQQINGLKEILGTAIIGIEDTSLDVLLSEKLRQSGKTVAFAESCTGGNLAHRLTAIAGSSDIFKGAIVAYSNEVKISALKVNRTDLETHGAVSETVVRQMAENARLLLKTDFAVATSGIAGPSGGTDEKPVGTCWIAVASETETISRKYQFSPVREQNIERATQSALLMLNGIID